MDANLVLWIGQALLALAFIGVGFGHAFGFAGMASRPGMDWLYAVGSSRMRAIGVLEILGGGGLILPAVTHVLPWLTPLAATLFAVLMGLAAVFHARRPGEGRNIVTNLVLGAIAAVVAFGRFVIAPL
jgi:crotonobetainyl-CoA:carnitine CoA-transferase CaiB-like acyl-CoA transferase